MTQVLLKRLRRGLVTRSRTVMLTMAAWPLCYSCNNTDFSGGSGKKNQRQLANPPLPSVEKEINFKCDDGQIGSLKKLVASGELSIRLEGEFCTKKADSGVPQSTILFVVDGSGSMALNDPQIAGSCGRYQAVKAIFDRLKTFNSNKVSMAFQVFGDLSETLAKPVSLDQAVEFVKPAAICRDDLRGTNYQSALFEARKSLEGREGRKIVYFITDGLPSASGISLRDLRAPNIPPTSSQDEIDSLLGPVYQQGLDAGIRLRELSDTTFNALFLQPRSLGGQAVPSVERPSEYLKKIVGDPARFRLVSSAQELAAKITELESSGPHNLRAATATGVLEADGFEPKSLRVKSVVPTDNPQIWSFVLESFELFSRPGEETLNRISIKIENDEGKIIETMAEIEYLREK